MCSSHYSKYIEQKLLKFPNLNPIIAKKAFGGIRVKGGEIWEKILKKEDIQEWAREIGVLLK
ncbi:MAG: hypothetical protein KGD63_06545 [Candidatus Lokiarchaeota archaeon]|nr:hypothetical protein [Candidatus Lokiarchaeota archaeon]